MNRRLQGEVDYGSPLKSKGTCGLNMLPVCSSSALTGCSSSRTEARRPWVWAEKEKRELDERALWEELGKKRKAGWICNAVHVKRRQWGSDAQVGQDLKL